MKYRKAFVTLFCVVLFLLNTYVLAQDVKREKMEKLNFMIGEWVGTSKVYENGILAKEGSAYEKISYDLDRSILIVELNTEFLQLHTIILYDEQDQKYYYHRFSKTGAARYSAEYKDGQLIVWRDEKTKFVFRRIPDEGFQEYGEQLINGEWIMTFEDTFINTQ